RYLGHGLRWFTQPGNWMELSRALAGDALANPAVAGSAILVFAGLFYWRRRMRAKLSELGDMASRSICCRIAPTLEAVVLTSLLAAAGPCLIGFIAWRLAGNVADSEFIKAVAAGLSSTAGLYLVLELLRQMLRRNGLFDAHFDWSSATCQILRRQSWWAIILLLPLVLVTVIMNSQEHERGAATLGRLGFMALMAICSLFAWRTLRAAGAVHRHIVASGRGEWFIRLRFIWYPMAVTLPLALAVLAAWGYYYTAQQLAQRMIATAYVMLGLTLLRSLLLRWVLVRRRKLAIDQARQRRAASQADENVGSESGMIASIPTAPEPRMDLAAINAQTRHLVEYSLAVTGVLGVWLIWVDVLPALGFLNRVELWHTLEQARATTLADLGLSLLIFATMFIAAKNVPGLLEMLLLHHLPLDTGLRYTAGTVSRYLIIIIGTVLGCQSMGISWAKVQWLVAAVSVGLGFGLQEIFANFVSGLIILFERPIRVGDVVTVSDVTGVVSRIRMRATT
ncbi:MAG: mechanosensitive ion channel, partial [Patescibacteria group bacterium]|nr:mechanosensitive ion channel [Patescibacteria group bacterium]